MSQVIFRSVLVWLFLIIALSVPASLRAQTGQISGIVTDPEGKTVAGADITVRNQSTGVTRSAATSEEGNYAISALPPGVYSLRTQKPGFKLSEFSNLTLPADTPVRFDVTLIVGEVVENVTVRAGASVIQDTPQMGTSVTRREYESLPMVQLGRIRSPAAFVLLAPGVQGTVRLDGAQNATASNSVQVHGQPNFIIEYLVDGLAAGPGYGNFNESAPAVGGVQEFRFITSQLPAEYGATGAAAASFVIRSGADEFHGDAYDYTRNSALDAKSVLVPSKPQLKLSEFGASFGGPLSTLNTRDGTHQAFFFLSFGGSRKRGADGVSTAVIPTPAQRLGDFSGLRDSAGRPVIIYDPATTRIENGVSVRDPFPGNVIPPNRIDPAAAAIAALYPAPNSA